METTLTPQHHAYWRETVKNATRMGMVDEILSPEDFLEGALIHAYNQGVESVACQDTPVNDSND